LDSGTTSCMVQAWLRQPLCGRRFCAGPNRKTMRTMGLRISTLKVLNGRRSPGLVLSTCPISPHGKNRHRLRSAPGCRMWSWFRGCARCPRAMASPGSTRRSGKSCPLTVTTSARSRVRRRPGFRVRRHAVRESSCGSARTGSPPGKARPRSWRVAGFWPLVTTGGALTGGWCPANGPAFGTSCCTPSRTR
jgi:hypothetical protein